MNKHKDILINMAYFISALLLYLMIVTLFASINVLNYKSVSVISFIYTIILFMIMGFRLARKLDKRGYLSGFLMGTINIVLMFLISILFNTPLDFKILTYYLVLILSSIFGGMLGINFKKK